MQSSGGALTSSNTSTEPSAVDLSPVPETDKDRDLCVPADAPEASDERRPNPRPHRSRANRVRHASGRRPPPVALFIVRHRHPRPVTQWRPPARSHPPRRPVRRGEPAISVATLTAVDVTPTPYSATRLDTAGSPAVRSCRAPILMRARAPRPESCRRSCPGSDSTRPPRIHRWCRASLLRCGRHSPGRGATTNESSMRKRQPLSQTRSRQPNSSTENRPGSPRWRHPRRSPLPTLRLPQRQRSPHRRRSFR